MTIDLEWQRKTLSHLNLNTTPETVLMYMRSEGWHQYEALKSNVEALCLQGLDDLLEYGEEISRAEFTKNDEEIVARSQRVEALYQKTKNPCDSQETEWHRVVCRIQRVDPEGFEQLRLQLAEQMEEAVRLDLKTKSGGFAEQFKESKRNRVPLIKNILKDNLGPIGFEYSERFSSKRYYIAFRKPLANGYSLFYCAHREAINRGSSDDPRAASTGVTLFVASDEAEGDRILEYPRRIGFDFGRGFTTYPVSLFAPYLRFADLAELEINTLANLSLYKLGHDELVESLIKGLSEARI